MQYIIPNNLPPRPRYPNAEVLWCQEEPMNMGAFHHVTPRVNACIRALGRATTGRLKYSGRAQSAATATGFGEVHTQEQKQLIEQALVSDGSCAMAGNLEITGRNLEWDQAAA